MNSLDWINALGDTAAQTAFVRCCGSRRWAERMTARRPFNSEPELLDAAETIWRGLSPGDWFEAFTAHPKIGDRIALRREFADSTDWSTDEQRCVTDAPETILQALADGNQRYEARFGHIFIVCATGKSALEMLTLLEERLGNSPEQELRIAAGEQEKITRQRLQRLPS